MKDWIITAMKEEANHIISSYKLKQVKKFDNLTIYENNKIVLALVWIWKIQSTLWTTFLVNNYNLDKLINIWIAGSLLWNKANIWDVFLINKISQHDIYLPFEWSHLDFIKKDIVIKNNLKFKVDWFNINNNWYCLTWDQFIDDIQKVQNLKDKYNADVIEMEAFAIASVAREFWILDKCIFIKAISDWADSNSKDDHMWNLDFAMNNSLKVLDKIL